MLPSWTRSSIGIWLRPYLRAMDTTRRRLASMKRWMAAGPPRRATRAPPGWRTWARRPSCGRPGPRRAGARRAGRPRWSCDSSTSVIASSRGVRAISSRYMPTLSRPSTSRVRCESLPRCVPPFLWGQGLPVGSPCNRTTTTNGVFEIPGSGRCPVRPCRRGRLLRRLRRARSDGPTGCPTARISGTSQGGEPVADPVQDPGGEGPLPPGVVAPADAAVPGRHLGLAAARLPPRAAVARSRATHLAGST